MSGDSFDSSKLFNELSEMLTHTLTGKEFITLTVLFPEPVGPINLEPANRRILALAYRDHGDLPSLTQ